MPEDINAVGQRVICTSCLPICTSCTLTSPPSSFRDKGHFLGRMARSRVTPAVPQRCSCAELQWSWPQGYVPERGMPMVPLKQAGPEPTFWEGKGVQPRLSQPQPP